MRWMWVDRFVDFQSGKQATSIKNVSLSEDHIHDHFPGFPVMPHSLIIEGLAQTGGILLGEANKFEKTVVLAKIPKMTFHSWAAPGDQLTYHATLLDNRSEGGVVECSAKVGDRLVAEGEIFFAHVTAADTGAPQVDQKNFVFSMNLMGIIDVGKAGDESLP